MAILGAINRRELNFIEHVGGDMIPPSYDEDQGMPLLANPADSCMSEVTPLATTVCFVVHKRGIKCVPPDGINGRKVSKQ